MKSYRSFRALPVLLALVLCVTSMGWGSSPRAARAAPSAQQSVPEQANTPVQSLPALNEVEPNDLLYPNDQANVIGNGQLDSWQQLISGRVASAGDIDYYRFVLSKPGASVTIRLGNLPADYDLVLASGANGLDAGDGGLESIVDVGGQIASIGGQIASIGGQIASIGGQIASIGGQIASIGGQIASISARPDRQDEQIDTFLWQPGIYYIGVSGSNGANSPTPYALEVKVESGALSQPPPAPEVRLSLGSPLDINYKPNAEVLYITNRARMQANLALLTASEQISESQAISDTFTALNYLAYTEPDDDINVPPGYIIDIGQLNPLGTTEPIASLYARWDKNQANPLEANRVAKLIDNVISAATRRNPSGPGDNAYQFGFGPARTTPPLPKLKYVVLVGGDDVLPFFRLPDLATIASEREYFNYTQAVQAGGIIDPNSAQGASLRFRMMLSDNPYGAYRPYRMLNSPLFLPRLAVGRLVEKPSEIAAYLRPYANAAFCPETAFDEPCPLTIDMRPSQPTNAPRTSLVTGYDFLIDNAQAISNTLHKAGLTPDGLINKTWNRADLSRIWLDGLFAPSTAPINRSPRSIASVNAHFDHWQAIPAAANGLNRPLTRTDTLAAYDIITPTKTLYVSPSMYQESTYWLTNRLGYSVGCHSGYNLLASALNGKLADQALRNYYAADFAQGYIKQGGNWVGNSGYGYGTLDGVDYSERLAVLYSEELARATTNGMSQYDGVTIGAALVKAKARYLRELTTLDFYDAKVLQIWTLYGLPFVHLYVPNPLPPAAEELRQERGQRIIPTGVPPSPLGVVTRTITATISFANDELVQRGNATIGQSARISAISIEDSFVPSGGANQPEARAFRANQLGAPELPQWRYDLTALSALSNTQYLKLRDVAFLRGSYGNVRDYNPVISQVVTETDKLLRDSVLEPSFAAGIGLWYPARFYNVSRIENERGPLDQLIAAAAQFRAERDDAGKTIGRLRPYRQMVFQVFYIDPAHAGASKALADELPPAIEAVSIESGGDQNTLVSVELSDFIAGQTKDTGISELDVVYTDNADSQEWRQLRLRRLERDGKQEIWGGKIPLPPGAVRMMVRASDAAGNNSVFTNKGRFTGAVVPNSLFLPIVYR